MLFKSSIVFGLVAYAMAKPLVTTLTPLVASINVANADLITSHVRLNIFHGTDLDLRSLKRQAFNTLSSLNDIASAISDRRLNEVDAAGVVGSLHPIFVNLDLLVKATKPKHGLLGSRILDDESTEFVDAVAETADNLAAAIDSSAPRNWSKIFRDVNRLYMNNIRDARDEYGNHETKSVPRPVAIIPVAVPVPVEAPYPAPPTYDPTIDSVPAPAAPIVGTATIAPAEAAFEVAAPA